MPILKRILNVSFQNKRISIKHELCYKTYISKLPHFDVYGSALFIAIVRIRHKLECGCNTHALIATVATP